MPAQKSGKLVKPAAKPATKNPIKRATPAKAQLKVVKNDAKAPPGGSAKPMKDKPVSLTKSSAKPTEKPAAKEEAKKTAAKPAAATADEVVKKKPGRPPKAPAADGGEAPGSHRHPLRAASP